MPQRHEDWFAQAEQDLRAAAILTAFPQGIRANTMKPS